jgi:hypothetical protein
MYNPNSVGLNGHPCFTPMRDWKVGVRPVRVRTHTGTLAYRAWMASMMNPRMPIPSSLVHSWCRGTVLPNVAVKAAITAKAALISSKRPGHIRGQGAACHEAQMC